MKLTLHIMGKDLRCLRGRLALWVAVLVAKTLLGFAILSGDAPGYLARHVTEASVVLVGLDIGLCFLLAALLVQEDLLVGTTSFWQTRPVSGARLLAAKLLGAGLLFGVLPVLVWLPWWLHCGYGPREIAWAVAETLLWQSLVVVPAMLLAALTDSLSRVLLWSLVLLAGVPGGFLLLSGPWIKGAAAGVGASRVTVMMATLLVAALAAVVRQYLTRRRWRSLTWFGVGGAATLVVAALWPWNIYAGLEQRELREENAAQAAGAFLEFEGAVALPQSQDQVATGRQRVEVHLRMRGLPAGLASAGDTVRQTWHWAAGPDLSIEGWGWGVTDPMNQALGIAPRAPDAETERYLDDQRAAHGRPPRPVPQAEDGFSFNVSGQGPRSLVARLLREPAGYRATARFLLLRLEVWIEEALVPGRWQSHAATGVRIARVEPRGPAVRVTVVQAQGALGNLALYGLVPTRAMQLAMNEPALRVINRAQGDSLFFAWDHACPPMRVGTVVVSWMKGMVQVPAVVRGGKWVPRDRDWFAGARFAVVGAREVGRIVREVKVDKCTLSLVVNKPLPAPKR